MKFTLTATGDSILNAGYQEGGYPGFKEVCDYIAKGQARFGNLETCVTNWDTYASAYCGGTWISCEPRILDQILGYGFNFLGYANNHTMDLGPDGMLETLKHVDERGIAIAGAGENLDRASAPVYRNFDGGRVAFISITSTFEDAARAGHASKSMKGRPGLNALRHTKKLAVTEEHFKTIKEIAAATEINAVAERSRADGFRPPLADGITEFGPVNVILSDDGKEGYRTYCDKRDLARVKDAIKDAKYIADYVVIMFHCHEYIGADMGNPAQFAREFTHFCIDNGADVILGNGTHQFKPIEIYNGKPIFHSLGNFCFQSNMLLHQPADIKDKFNLGDISDVQALAARNKDWTIGLHTQFFNFRTVIPYLEFEDGVLTKAQMKPVELGFEKSRTFKGIPYPADEKATKEIYERLKELSEPFGTKLELNSDGTIEIIL